MKTLLLVALLLAGSVVTSAQSKVKPYSFSEDFTDSVGGVTYVFGEWIARDGVLFHKYWQDYIDRLRHKMPGSDYKK